MTPNPSLHPMCYGWLRQPPHAGELKRLGVMKVKPITGSASVTMQPTTIAPAAPPHTYFGVAQGMLPGVRILAV
jgi:hypothetical protein